jgi:serine/threonine protein kinase
MKKLTVSFLLAVLSLDSNTRQDVISSNSDFNRQFLDMLKRIFIYDPAKRITAKQALNHPWFRESSLDDGTEAARIRDEKLAQIKKRASNTNGYR